MTITVGSTPVQSIYVGSTPVQEVYVGSTKIWPSELPPPLQWFRWESPEIPGYCRYTNARNPEVDSRVYRKEDSEYIIDETVGKVILDGSGNVATIVTDYDPDFDVGYNWDYDGEEN